MLTERILTAVGAFVLLSIGTCAGAYLFAPAPPLTDGLPADVDAFEWRGHTCVRWKNEDGSDMECWEGGQW